MNTNLNETIAKAKKALDKWEAEVNGWKAKPSWRACDEAHFAELAEARTILAKLEAATLGQDERTLCSVLGKSIPDGSEVVGGLRRIATWPEFSRHL